MAAIAILVAGVGTLSPIPAFSSRASAQTAAERPNILVIVTDDQRWDMFAAMPKLRRRLMPEAINFTQAVTTTPMCCPSRASIMSGQYAHNHGVESMNNPEALNQQHTMQYELQQAGYRTAAVGKYLNTWTANPPYFDKWAIADPRGTYNDAPFNVNGHRVSDTDYITTFERQMARRFLKGLVARPDDPWMLYVAPYAPHAPSVPQRRYRYAKVGPFPENPARREVDLSDKPPFVRSAANHTSKQRVLKRRTKQLRALRSVDDLVISLMEVLRSSGTLKDTLIVFTSDNGFHWYEHRLDRKFTPYEASVRVPLLVRWGDRFGSVDDRLVANIDIAPTIYEATGIEPSYTIDGRSLFSTHDRDRILIEQDEYSYYPTWNSFYAKDWRYTEYPERGFREYYGTDDPWELNNVYGNAVTGDEPSEGAKLSAELAVVTQCSGDSCP